MQVLCFQKAPQQQLQLQVAFPTRVIPNPKPRFLALFHYPKPGFFSTNQPGYFEKPGIAVAFKY